MTSNGHSGPVVAGAARSFPVATSIVDVQVEPSETEGRFAMIRWTVPPGAPAPPQHIHHDATETFFVLDGELVFPMADENVRVSGGDRLHIPSGTPHTLSNPGQTEAHALEIFSPGYLLGLVEAMGQLFASGRPDPADVEATLRRFQSELAAPSRT